MTDASNISLEDHNRSRAQQIGQFGSTLIPNGIACPECGRELVDSTPNMVLATWPAQYRVHCPSCNYTGTRL